ncbi:MAG: lysine biosynthesis protein LysW [Thermoprotei archaeon]|nr:MAG: lysine biosynthesis protein LysW [Thermoprotei archaeon]
MKVKCPECGGDIPVPDDVVVGEIVSCPDCGQEYEVYELGPEGPKIRQAEVAAEDWGE